MFKLLKVIAVTVLSVFALNAQAAYVSIQTSSPNYTAFDTDTGSVMTATMFGMESRGHLVTFDQSGRYEMSLRDELVPNQFVQLGALLSSSAGLVSAVSLTTSAELAETSEFLVEAGTYYLTTWGITDGQAGNLFFEMSYLEGAEVPVPPAAILFGSALMGLMAYGRRSQSKA